MDDSLPFSYTQTDPAATGWLSPIGTSFLSPSGGFGARGGPDNTFDLSSPSVEGGLSGGAFRGSDDEGGYSTPGPGQSSLGAAGGSSMVTAQVCLLARKYTFVGVGWVGGDGGNAARLSVAHFFAQQPFFLNGSPHHGAPSPCPSLDAQGMKASDINLQHLTEEQRRWVEEDSVERAAARAEVEAAADKARQAYMVRCGQCGPGSQWGERKPLHPHSCSMVCQKLCTSACMHHHVP